MSRRYAVAKGLAGGIAGFLNLKSAFEDAKRKQEWEREQLQTKERGDTERTRMTIRGGLEQGMLRGGATMAYPSDIGRRIAAGMGPDVSMVERGVAERMPPGTPSEFFPGQQLYDLGGGKQVTPVWRRAYLIQNRMNKMIEYSRGAYDDQGNLVGWGKGTHTLDKKGRAVPTTPLSRRQAYQLAVREVDEELGSGQENFLSEGQNSLSEENVSELIDRAEMNDMEAIAILKRNGLL